MDSNNWRVKRDPAAEPAPGTPNRGFQQRRSNGFGSRDSPRGNGAFDQRDQRSSPAGSGFGSPRDRDHKAEQAIAEGRRLYVGNLPYDATVKDIEGLFTEIPVQAINMSFDPFTKKNPSYCFVDFESKDLAERVMEAFDGKEFRERPLKVKPGVKSSGGGVDRFRERQSGGSESPFDRRRRPEPTAEFETAIKDGRRLYVGGLPSFGDQATTDANVKDLFAGFNVQTVSKLIAAHESKKDYEGHHNFCFIELDTAGEAARAIRELNGFNKWDSTIKVREATGHAGKPKEKRRVYVGALPEFAEGDSLEAKMQELFEGFEISLASKLMPPKDDSKKSEDGNHNFCFVEFGSEDGADKALLLDYKEIFGTTVRVKPANSTAPKNIGPRGWGSSRG